MSLFFLMEVLSTCWPQLLNFLHGRGKTGYRGNNKQKDNEKRELYLCFFTMIYNHIFELLHILLPLSC